MDARPRHSVPESKGPRQTRPAGANTWVLECMGSAGEGKSRSRLYSIRLLADDANQAWPIAASALAIGAALAETTAKRPQGGRMHDLNLGNPVFAAFAIAASIMVLKAVAMSWLTVVRMIGVGGGFRSPEDLKKTP